MIKALDSSNYNTYSPTLTGTGASGSWAISITGNAAKESQLKKMADEGGIKIIFTNDKLIKTEFTPGHTEDKPLMSWK